MKGQENRLCWENETHKKQAESLNDKLLKLEAHNVEKLHKEIDILKRNLFKFVGGYENLYKLLRYHISPNDKSGHTCKGKKFVIHAKEKNLFMMSV